MHTDCLVSADRVRIAVVLQLGRNDEYVTLRDARQTHEDQARCHHGRAQLTNYISHYAQPREMSIGRACLSV